MKKFLLTLILYTANSALLNAQTFTFPCPTPDTSKFKVLATLNGVTYTTPDRVIISNELPYNGTAPWFVEDFNYTTTTQLRQNPINSRFYGSAQSIGVNVECNQTVRLNFNPSEATGGLCDRYFVGYDITFPNTTKELYIEFRGRFSDGFMPTRLTSDTTTTGCVQQEPNPNGPGQVLNWWNGVGFVMLMGRVDNGSGAFAASIGEGWPIRRGFEIGAACHFEWPITSTWTKEQDENYRYLCGWHILRAHYQYSYPLNDFDNKLVRLDGKWHVYRFYFKTDASSPNRGALGVWIDGEHMGTLPVQDVTSNNFIGLSLGRFMEHRPVKQQYVEFAKLKVWNTNPGWSLCEKFCYQ